MLLTEYAATVGLGAYARFVSPSLMIAPNATAPAPVGFSASLVALATSGPTFVALRACADAVMSRRLEQSMIGADWLTQLALDDRDALKTTATLWAARFTNTDGGGLQNWLTQPAWELARDHSTWNDDTDAAFDALDLGAWGNPKNAELMDFAATAEGAKVLRTAGELAYRARLYRLALCYLRMVIETSAEHAIAGFLAIECMLDLGMTITQIETAFPSVESAPDLRTYCLGRIALNDDWTGTASFKSGRLTNALQLLLDSGASRILPTPLPDDTWTFGNVAALAVKLRDGDDAALAAYQQAHYLDGRERAWLYSSVPRARALLVDDTNALLPRVPADRSLWKFLAMTKLDPDAFRALIKS